MVAAVGESMNTASSKLNVEEKMDRYSGEPDDNVGRIYRHWHPQSEKYTGGDALLTAIDEGWMVEGVIFRQEFWLAGVRRVCVFHIDLRRGDETAKMLVMQNPYVTRMVHELGAQVVLINQRKQTDYDRWS
jgi:hypothetical protein